MSDCKEPEMTDAEKKEQEENEKWEAWNREQDRRFNAACDAIRQEYSREIQWMESNGFKEIRYMDYERIEWCNGNQKENYLILTLEDRWYCTPVFDNETIYEKTEKGRTPQEAIAKCLKEFDKATEKIRRKVFHSVIV